MNTQELIRLAHATKRQVQTWREEGILHPRQIDWAHDYSPDDALRALIAVNLRKHSIGTPTVARILKAGIPADANYLLVDECSGHNASDCRSNTTWAWHVTEEQVIEALKAATRGYWLVDVGRLRLRASSSLTALSEPTAPIVTNQTRGASA